VCYEICLDDDDCSIPGTICSIPFSGYHEMYLCRGLYPVSYKFCTLP
jgi:hypothetical protein